MDSVDQELLRLLQLDNRQTYEDLAAAVGVSASACRRRVTQLRASGVITADIAVVDPALLGLGCEVMTMVTLEKDEPAMHRRFRSAMDRCQQVIACRYVTGKADYLLHVVLADMREYDRFCDEHLSANPDVANSSSLVVLKTTKQHGPLRPTSD